MTPTDGLRRATTRSGHTMFVDPDDLIGRAILRTGSFEHNAIRLMVRALRAVHARRVLDVGANIGNHALAFSAHCEQVLAFEPGSRAFALLERNLAANPGAPVRAFAVGLSDRDRTAVLRVGRDGNLGGASVSEGRSAAAETEVVQLRVGDRLLADADCRDRIDFVKVDVEGHEPEVLLGLRETIASNQPLVSIEWNDDEVRRRVRDDRLFEELFPDWEVHGIGHRAAARAEIKAKPLGRLRWRLLARRRVGLSRFLFSEDYHNLLLVPPGRRDVLRALPRLRAL